MINESEDIKDESTSVTGGLGNVLNIILAAFAIPKKPIAPLPPPLIMIGAKLRSGVSPSTVAARIIARQSEAGIVVGDVFGDGPNTQEAMLVVVIEEIMNSLLTEAKVDVVIPPGISVMTIGVGNLGAPVVSQGVTTSLAIGDGIIR